MVGIHGILVSFWDGLFSRAILVLRRVSSQKLIPLSSSLFCLSVRLALLSLNNFHILHFNKQCSQHLINPQGYPGHMDSIGSGKFWTLPNFKMPNKRWVKNIRIGMYQNLGARSVLHKCKTYNWSRLGIMFAIAQLIGQPIDQSRKKIMRQTLPVIIFGNTTWTNCSYRNSCANSKIACTKEDMTTHKLFHQARHASLKYHAPPLTKRSCLPVSNLCICWWCCASCCCCCCCCGWTRTVMLNTFVVFDSEVSTDTIHWSINASTSEASSIFSTVVCKVIMSPCYNL